MRKVVSIPYGKEIIQLELPDKNISGVYTPKDLETIPNQIDEINRAIKSPIGCPPISSIVSPDTKVVIISDDNTRITPVNLILPVIMKELDIGGVVTENVKVIFASGTHRAMTYEEQKQKIGSSWVDKLQVISYDFRDTGSMVNLGYTANGTPVSVRKEILDADIAIGIGSIVPHHVCGFSGGAKIVQPGICSEAVTACTHLLSVRKSERSFLGVLENPVREEMEAVAEVAGVRYIFNTVMDRCGNIYKAVFGDIKEAFRVGVSACLEIYNTDVRERTPVVIASSSPCDLEFWQAHKTLYPADMVVSDGGMVIIITPCPEGVAVTHPELLEFAGLNPDTIEKMIDNGSLKDLVAASAGWQWSKMRQRAEICLVSKGISSHQAKNLNFTHFNTLDEAMEKVWQKFGADVKINILTNGPDTLPKLNEEV